MLKPLKVFGTSMSPFIKNGDVVFYEDDFSLKKGDIILYFLNETKFVHRVYKINGDDIFVSNDDDIEYHIINKKFVFGKVVCKYNGMIGYTLGSILKIIRKIRRCLFRQN
ncbi:MAG: S24/S26 family peptidase [Elusimicrobiota bacterium]